MKRICEICLTEQQGMRYAKRAACFVCIDKAIDFYIEKSSERMNCWGCGTQMIWGGDHSFDDVGMEGEGIASNFSCPNCSAHADFYVSILSIN